MRRSIAIAGAAGLFAIGLSGCETMSAEECLTADWEQIGYEDGSRGRPPHYLENRRQACVENAGIQPDGAAWERGRQAGLETYCTPQNGWRIGSSGGAYEGVCFGSNAYGFERAFNTGRRKYELQQAVNDLDGRVNDVRYRTDQIDRDRADVEARLKEDDVPPQERDRLLRRLKELSERRGSLREQERDLVDERAYAEAELSRFRADLSGPYRDYDRY